MAAGLSMEVRKRQSPSRPVPQGHNWLDEDLLPWLFGDYAIDDQHPEVQIMLDLAENLADARNEWALQEFRDVQNERGSSAGSCDSIREPRHVANDRLIRRGFDIRRE